MIKNSLRRRDVKMPEYFEQNDWRKYYYKAYPIDSFKIKNKHRSRPVYVNEKFQFQIEIRRKSESAPPLESLFIWEKLPDRIMFSERIEITEKQIDGETLKAKITNTNISKVNGKLAYCLGANTPDRFVTYRDQIIASAPVIYEEIGMREKALMRKTRWQTFFLTLLGEALLVVIGWWLLSPLS